MIFLAKIIENDKFDQNHATFKPTNVFSPIQKHGKIKFLGQKKLLYY